MLFFELDHCKCEKGDKNNIGDLLLVHVVQNTIHNSGTHMMTHCHIRLEKIHPANYGPTEHICSSANTENWICYFEFSEKITCLCKELSVQLLMVPIVGLVSRLLTPLTYGWALFVVSQNLFIFRRLSFFF